MTPPLDLIARLEAGPGTRELSYEVARALGWTSEQREPYTDEPYDHWISPQGVHNFMAYPPLDFTNSINAAITAIPDFNKHIKEPEWHLDKRSIGCHAAVFRNGSWIHATAPTAPLAICAAALRARSET